MRCVKAQMNNFHEWIHSTDERFLKATFNEILIASGFGIRGFIEEHFEPFGYTALWLLSESHFAVHTFPECGKTYIELSSCVEAPFVAFNQILRSYNV